MNTFTTHTCQLECDELALSVIDTSTGTTVVAVPWPAEVYRDDEPDYEALSDTMTEMVESTLNEAGYQIDSEPHHPHGSLHRAVAQAITPGGPNTPRTFTLLRIEWPTDKVDVTVTHEGHDTITVEILDGGKEGNRETDVATIGLYEYGRWMVMLTWKQADELAAALTRVTGIARNG